MNEEYYIGQIFEGIYPPDAATWCDNNNAIIEEKYREEETEQGILQIRYYEICEIPAPVPPTKEEQSKNREWAYVSEVDGITAHIDRLKDEEQTPEVVAEIEALKAERAEKVAAIKERYPYPEGE